MDANLKAKVQHFLVFRVRKRAGTIVGLSCNVACLLSILIQPYTPNISEIMAAQLNVPKEVFVLTEKFHQLLPNGHKIGKVR